MSSLTGRDISETFRDNVRFDNAGAGLPADGNELVQLQDGHGETIPVRVSKDKFDIISGFMLGGTTVTATASNLNALVGFLTEINGNNTAILVSRAATESVPGSLLEGQLHLDLDTMELMAGDSEEAVIPVKVDGSNLIGTIPDGRLSSTVPLRNGQLQTLLNAQQWGGHKVLVGTSTPGGEDGDDGDFFFVYTP